MLSFRFLPQYFPYFNDGIIVTLIVSFFVVLFGSIIGTLVAIGKMSKIAPLRWLLNIYLELFRNTPMLVQISIGFILMSGQGLPNLHIGILAEDLNRLIPGIIVLSLNSGAYTAEIVRAGITAVPAGQTEAAHSLGIRPWATMTRVILPQALRNILPALGNEFVTIVKDSSLLYTIGIIELYAGAQAVQNATYISLAPMLFAAGYYFVVCFILNRVIARLEKRVGKGYAK
ncbi:MAG: amino acid ABC transporter permease [Streptococcaceae bacterium]|jgi:polar amino acid transport system permease protein|nr:amino acid ABC transporter permease [Streptococcaceae bacterium]